MCGKREFEAPAVCFTRCENHEENRADVAQPVEQRFRNFLRSITANSREIIGDRRNDGRQAPHPPHRTVVQTSRIVAEGTTV
jgi:hypothetical protein